MALSMTKKQFLLIALAVLLGGSVLYLNRDWFTQPPIQVSHRFHALAGRFAPDPGTVPLMFEFSRRLKLTSVRVVNASALETNNQAVPLWELTSDSNSLPTKGFLYGMVVPGMRPVNKGSTPEPPELGVKYRLLIGAGSLKVQHDFTLVAPGQ
jgi:hypothetical protein